MWMMMMMVVITTAFGRLLVDNNAKICKPFVSLRCDMNRGGDITSQCRGNAAMCMLMHTGGGYRKRCGWCCVQLLCIHLDFMRLG
uniref:Putative secreted protein n=1 Tax=Anopheles marajoara TaxID=58244 RepID=A0A2M4CB91_9DIPT